MHELCVSLAANSTTNFKGGIHMAKLHSRNQSWPLESSPEQQKASKKADAAYEKFEKRQRELEETEDESLRNSDGSLNHSAVMRRRNRVR